MIHTSLRPNLSLNCRGIGLDLSRPVVMGILNVTPDSFHDGGRYADTDAALRRAEEMLEEGASILDIGGYSSRPGAVDISPEEELGRLIGPVRAILDRFPNAILSVDTFRARVAKEMLEAGVHMVNDISGGQLDEKMYETVAAFGAPYVLMHMQGRPQTMQQDPQYENVTDDIWEFFNERIRLAREAGIRDLILDPGFGFGKTLAHNYELFRNLSKFNALGLPLLVGVSRKSMVYKPFGLQPAEALELSSALHLRALEQGASILRVHDIAPAKRLIGLYEMLNGAV